jgi:hypothetical protein
VRPASLPISDLHALILRDGALDLYEQARVRVIARRLLEKRHRHAAAFEFFEDGDLTGILARDLDRESGRRRRPGLGTITEAVESRTIGTNPAVTVIHAHVRVDDLVVVRLRETPSASNCEPIVPCRFPPFR